MWGASVGISLLTLVLSSQALRYDPAQVGFNLNENTTAVSPVDYWGSWPNHTYHPSPSNWRFPFYTVFLDRYVNGDPKNDNANGTQFEVDHMANQLRHGGDIQGFVDSLDYIQGLGIKVCGYRSRNTLLNDEREFCGGLLE